METENMPTIQNISKRILKDSNPTLNAQFMMGTLGSSVSTIPMGTVSNYEVQMAIDPTVEAEDVVEEDMLLAKESQLW
jgi:hypothetical protein